MSHPVVIRVKKLPTPAQIAGSAAHTWRENPTPNADSNRTPNNEDWRPVNSSAGLLDAVNERLKLVTETPASKPVRCLEYLITAHQHAFKEGGGQVDSDAYFRDALAFLEKKHGRDNVVAVNIQRDELAPHLVAYVVPLVEVEAKTRKRSVIVGTNEDGTKKRATIEVEQQAGVRLSAAHYVGNRGTLSKLQTDFADAVGKPHGLVRGIPGSKARHTTVKEFYAGLQRAESGKLRTFDPAAVEPKVLEKKRFSRVVETSEQVAERLTRGMHAEMRPLVAAAGETATARKKQAEAEATARAKQAELDKVRPVLDATAGMTPAEVAEAVGAWKIQQRAAMLAKAVAERVDKLARAALAGGDGILQRFARWCMKASAAKSGDVAKVDWPAVEKAWADAPETRQAHKHASIARTLIEYGPSHAGTTPAAQAKLLQEAQRLDKIDALKAGKKASRGHGLGM